VRTVNGLSVHSVDGQVFVFVERGKDGIEFDAEGSNFNLDFALSRRSARQMRDWLNAYLDLDE
jgi:hypothetical protein